MSTTSLIHRLRHAEKCFLKTTDAPIAEDDYWSADMCRKAADKLESLRKQNGLAGMQTERWTKKYEKAETANAALRSQLEEYKDAECRAVKLHGEALKQLEAVTALRKLASAMTYDQFLDELKIILGPQQPPPQGDIQKRGTG